MLRVLVVALPLALAVLAPQAAAVCEVAPSISASASSPADGAPGLATDFAAAEAGMAGPLADAALGYHQANVEGAAEAANALQRFIVPASQVSEAVSRTGAFLAWTLEVPGVGTAANLAALRDGALGLAGALAADPVPGQVHIGVAAPLHCS